MSRKLEITQPFNLKLNLKMGQAFRWRECDDGWFSGVLGANLYHIRQIDGGIEYRVGGSNGEREASDKDDQRLRRYIREDQDVDAIHLDLMRRDEKLEQLVLENRGMRVLRQEPWECFVAYICSAPATVEQITANVELLATEFGDPVSLGEDTRNTFPGPEPLIRAGEGYLRRMRLGLKAPRIIGAATRVVSDIGIANTLTALSYPVTKQHLMEFDGIRDKVADCIALMCLDKLEAFPIDRHIYRAIADRYPDWVLCR